jgi:hypothetical protein
VYQHSLFSTNMHNCAKGKDTAAHLQGPAYWGHKNKAVTAFMSCLSTTMWRVNGHTLAAHTHGNGTVESELHVHRPVTSTVTFLPLAQSLHTVDGHPLLASQIPDGHCGYSH